MTAVNLNSVNNTVKRYMLKGINDDQSFCDVCGKDHLKRVMWLVEVDGAGNYINEPFACGSTCGAKLLKCKKTLLDRYSKNYDSEVRIRRMNLANKHEFMKEHDRLIEELNKLGLMGKARFEHPLFKQAIEFKNKAYEWANLQEILIDLI